MKKSSLLLIIVVTLGVHFILPAQKVQEDGNHITDTIYFSDTVFINNDIFIDSNEILIIAPGSLLEFQGHYQIKVNGLVKAIGNISDSIIFTINDTTLFSDTSSVVGGWKGINFWNRNENDTSIFKYCRFEYGKSVSSSNSSKDCKGGAIYLNNYNAIQISNCIFHMNTAVSAGGGLYSFGSGEIIISENVFTHNRTFLDGGGICIISADNVLIYNNLFLQNTAFQYHLGLSRGNGAAIYLTSNFSPSIYEVFNNKVFNNFGLSILYESCDNYIFSNNLICNNHGTAYFNGNDMSYGKFINNTVCNNFGDPDGGGLLVFSNHLQIKNNIIWDNIGYFWEDTLQIQFYGQGVGLEVDNNCLNYGYEGNSNIESEPMIVNPTLGAGIDYYALYSDWSLLDSSPCINTGTPDTSGLYLPEFDIDGNQRVYGNRIDMGSYENQYIWLKVNNSPIFNNPINIYPNPGKDKIFIEPQPDMEGVWFDLVDSNGKQLMHSKITRNPTIFLRIDLKPGIYFYKIYTRKKLIKTGKWIKI